jgi:hypothetical protein
MSSELKSFEFTKPAGNKKRALLEDTKPEAPAVSEPVDKESEATSKTLKEEVKSKYSQTELLAIFDEIIFSGEYTENIVIKGKLHVTFRTRTSQETEEMSQILDSMGANLFSTLEQKRAMLSLQYSLMRYGPKDLSTLKKPEKEEFLGRLPSAVTFALINALSKFDEKVFEACQEAAENF